MAFAAAAVERAMTYQQVIMRVLAGSLTWLQAADILDIHPRSLRAMARRHERDPKLGLARSSPPAPLAPHRPRAPRVQRILRLYREHYHGFNVRHFHQPRPAAITAVTLSLQLRQPRPAGGRARGPSGAPAAAIGGAGSRARASASCCTSTAVPTPWLARRPTSARPSSPSSMTPPSACSTPSSGPARRSRPSWPRLAHVFCGRSACPALCTPTAPAGPSTPPRPAAPWIARTSPTLAAPRPPGHRAHRRLLAAGPRARRAPQPHPARPASSTSCARAGITTVDGRQRAICASRFIPDYNATFTRPPADPASAFVRSGDIDLDQILCEEEGRASWRAETMRSCSTARSICSWPAQPGQPTCAGWHVVVRRHLERYAYTVWRGAHWLGRFAAAGGDARHPPSSSTGPAGRFHRAGASLPPRAWCGG